VEGGGSGIVAAREGGFGDALVKFFRGFGDGGVGWDRFVRCCGWDHFDLGYRWDHFCRDDFGELDRFGVAHGFRRGCEPGGVSDWSN
jgi:hypothetical protein